MPEAAGPVAWAARDEPGGAAMRAVDIMTNDVISVGDHATVPAVARLLAERGISAVPVIDDDNRVVGMVSEGDLLHRAEIGTERRRSWWLDMMASTDKLAGDYHQVAQRQREGRHDPRRHLGHRDDPGGRYRSPAGDTPDQA